ncbi:hypothetical protein BDP81DRAFT_408742 [Colletotrichum phormii]|uniref:Uncharacterized protein n=1 Tax=Colletotrichum phormii TaxID=359342 RepID=A0AAI9ZL31_9PEZI|nr:uncharacterized protein BDP81DRAFT_408742 [Colletotrichum phormii]KAK1633666.1 hypothetical protein BDP81DRAFT_408742 [Colletotrichum phormii]
MVTTRNGKRTAAEAPAAAADTKKQKLPVRAKEGKTAASKKDETSRSSSSSSTKKRSSFVVELKSAAGTATGAQDVKEKQVITGAEQPAPRTDDEEIGDSDASPESVGDDAHEAAEQLAAEAKTALVAEGGDDGDDDSDSDAAPEAVSTSKAAVQAKKSAQAANKAIAEQQANQKRKRQERNARLQEQAAARKAQEDATPAEKSSEEEEEENGEETAETPAREATTTGRRKRLDLPSELPAEFLESDSEEDGGSEDGAGDRKPRKARKLETAEAQLLREARAPRDEVVGTTVFRTVKKEDDRLAPKAQKYSVNAKKALLARGRAPVKARRGFLV